MGSDPELETARLTLRRFREDDWRELQGYVSQPEVSRYDFEYPTSDEGCGELARYFAGQDGIWAVCLRDDNRLIGHVVCDRVQPREFLTWSLGFVFDPAYGSQGYALEASQRVVDHAFSTMGAHRIESHCHPDNERSWRLLERLGMRREGHHVRSVFLRRAADGSPEWCDSLDYAILHEEWRGG
jgi:ribosomal-protein-alanine N-acetyltransferase